MASQQQTPFSVDRYVVIHVATTCDEHGVYVTKDSAEVIELGWILIDANSLEEASHFNIQTCWTAQLTVLLFSSLTKVSLSSQSTHPSPPSAVRLLRHPFNSEPPLPTATARRAFLQ